MNDIFGEFFTGLNYWGSESAINMWEDFNPKSIEKDFQLMRSAGITNLRVFPLWPVFQPLKALYASGKVYEYGFGERPLPDTPAGRAGVDEAACEKFESFCALAEKYGFKLIVALITGHMSFRTYAPPAFEGKALLSDPSVIRWQLRFVKYFVTRFKNCPSIIGWDLGNEVSCMPGTDTPDEFYVWSSAIADAVKLCDGTRPVISGLAGAGVENSAANMLDIGEVCDIHTVHQYSIFSADPDPLTTMKPIIELPFSSNMNEDISGIPTFMQEFGAIGYMNCSKKIEAEFYRAALLTLLAHGCRGAMWWCAFDQGKLDYAPYRWNTIGSNYGFFDNGLNPKPIAKENRLFNERLSHIPNRNLPPRVKNAVILMPNDNGGINFDTLRAAYVLAKQAGFDVEFSYVSSRIADSELYIFPSIESNMSIGLGALKKIIERVKNGASLYISADSGLIRDIPEMTGVTIAYREKTDKVTGVDFKNKSLPVGTAFSYKIEKSDAEILASDENGDGVFFKNKLGSGNVYFLTVPLEKYVGTLRGAYYKDDIPDYSSIYRELAKGAGISRAAECTGRFILLTEHIIDEKSRYVFAINYNNRRESAPLKLNGNYDVEVVFGEGFSGDTLNIRENDGILLKLTEK